MSVLVRDEAKVATRFADRASRESRIRGTLVDMLLLGAAVVVLHLSISGPVPSGGDGGNWLALAREMLGESVMSADVTYEPVFIAVVAMLIPLLGPLGGLVGAAFAAEVVLVVAVYLTVRGLGRVPALVAGVTVLLLGYRLEAYAWGSYPQLLGVGFGVLTLWALMSYSDGRRRRFLILAGVGVLLTFLTHKLVGALLLGAVPMAAFHLYWQRRWSPAMRRRALAAVGIVGLVGIWFVLNWWSGTADGVQPTLNPLGHTLAEQVSRVFVGSEVPWMGVGLLCLLGFCIRTLRHTEAVIASAGFGWASSSIVAFLATGEARTLVQAQVALIPLAIVVGLHLRFPARGPDFWQRIAPTTVVLGLTALLGSLALTGLDRYEQSVDWYRVVGQEQLAVLDQMDSIADEDDLVVASRGPNGNPLGWWVEGYAGIPTYTSVDPSFLAFPDEREQSAAAAAMFESPPGDAGGVLTELGADFLVFDRRGPDSGWLGDGTPVGLVVVTDGTLMILENPDGA